MSDTVPEVPEVDDPHSRRTLYIVVSLVAVVLLIIMLIAYTGHKKTTEATQKAQQLSDAIVQAGFTSPDVDAIARLLGDDGGAVCASEPGALTEATLEFTMYNGAAGPGMRPVRVDRVVIGGERLIISTYCPENLAAFEQYVSTLTFADVAS